MKGQSGLSKLSVISWMSTVEGGLEEIKNLSYGTGVCVNIHNI